MPERTIYEQLTGVTVDDATVEQLDFTKNTFVDEKSIEYWRGVISISKILEASRTYPHGLPVPDSGTIVSVTCAAGDNITIQPPGSEIWMMMGMDMTGVGGSAEAMIAYFDGSAPQKVGHSLVIPTTGAIIGAYGAVSDVQILNPIILTNSLWWVVTETGSTNNMDIVYSYQKVSL
jgi:hypothetical protein